MSSVKDDLHPNARLKADFTQVLRERVISRLPRAENTAVVARMDWNSPMGRDKRKRPDALDLGAAGVHVEERRYHPTPAEIITYPAEEQELCG